MFHIGKWTPREDEIKILIPIVGNREKSIECLRVLAKHRIDQLRESEMGGASVGYSKDDDIGEAL